MGCNIPRKKASSPRIGALLGTCHTLACHATQSEEAQANSSAAEAPTHIITDDLLYFLVIHEVACALENKADLPAQVVLFEYLLVRHVENQLEPHHEGVEKLWAAAGEDLAARSALVHYRAVLAIQDLYCKRPA